MSKSKIVEPESFANDKEPTAEFIPEAGADFVVTPYIQDLTNRALAYLNIGYAVHLSGPAGTGKSTLAMHIASELGRPCTLLHGDDEFKASDLLGRDTGYRRNSLVDNYVSSIVKTEETLSVVWSSNRLTTACQKGHTLIYDEFTRSPATANNPFLSILEEGILNIPSSGKEKGYIKVHPNFRAIFTSNPEEYVGVHKTQDALLDRMITLRLDYQDRETEAAIVRAKSNCTQEDAESIVDVVRDIRKLLGGMNGPTVRSAIAIAKIVDHRHCKVDPDDPIFLITCADVLFYHTSRHPANVINPDKVNEIIRSIGRHKAKELAVKVPLKAEAAATSKPSRPTVEKEPTPTIVEVEKTSSTQTTSLEPEKGLLSATEELQKVLNGPFEVKPISERNYQPVAIDAPPPKLDFATEIKPPSVAASSPPTHYAPPRVDRIDSETASPLQMLEAVVSRFPRPPIEHSVATKKNPSFAAGQSFGSDASSSNSDMDAI